jgi:hypothetical protein
LVLAPTLALHLPLRLGFAVSRGGFERLAEAAQRSPVETPVRCGIYRIRNVEWGEGAALYLRTGTGGWAWMEHDGFVYDPGEPCPTPPYSRFETRGLDLGGGWWVFHSEDET